MGHVAYPENVPVDCVTEIIDIVRAGEFVAKRKEFAEHAWNVQGYLQRILIGAPAPLIGDPAAMALTDEQAIEALNRCCAEPANVAGALPIPARMLLDWLIKKLLEALAS